MSDRVRELAELQHELQLRCEGQRALVAAEFHAIERRFESVDRTVGAVRSVLTNPAVVIGGVVALFAIARVRGFRLIGRALLLGATVRRLVLTLKRL